MKVRPLSGALLAAGLSMGVTQAQADANFFEQALILEEQVGYALIESILSLVGMDVEHTGECSGTYTVDVVVGNWNISFDAGYGVDVHEGPAYAIVDDVLLRASLDGPADLQLITKGVKLVVNQDTKEPGIANQLGDTWVGVSPSPPYIDVQPFEGFFAFDYYGSMMSGVGEASLDGDLFDEMVIKDYWTPESVKGDDLDRVRIVDEGYELIGKHRYPRAKWDQDSTLWRPNGGPGVLSITKRLIAPDPVNNGCTMLLTALVTNYANGFATIGGELTLSDI